VTRNLGIYLSPRSSEGYEPATQGSSDVHAAALTAELRGHAVALMLRRLFEEYRCEALQAMLVRFLLYLSKFIIKFLTTVLDSRGNVDIHVRMIIRN
jgi:hypothetical protein